MVLVAAVLYGIVPGIVKVGGWFELLFVNGLGMSFNSGVVVYIILLAAALIWGVYESYTEKNKTRMAISFILTIALLGIPVLWTRSQQYCYWNLGHRCTGSFILLRTFRPRLRRNGAFPPAP